MLQGTQKKVQASSARQRTVRLDAEGPSSLARSASISKRFDPLTAFSKQLTPTPTPTTPASKAYSQLSNGKGKSKEIALPSEDINDYLWVDKYQPISEAELAVHVKKVENVRQWLTEAFEGGPSGKLCKYRRILAMTGPAGTGKTSTIRVLAQDMGFEIMEWKNSMSEIPSRTYGDDLPQDGYEGLFTKFEAFLTRASTCQNVFSGPPQKSSRRRIILLEDIPNILHPKTQAQFHEALSSFATSAPSNPPTPVIIIISDAGLRGETSDERRAEGGGWHKDKAEIVDVRTVLSKDLLGGPYVTEIRYNPIAPTLMRKALQAMLNTHFPSSTSTSSIVPSKEVLDLIVESSNGDIRSAIMALQFACVKQISKKKGKSAKPNNTLVLEAVTRREQSLALFHLMGKVLYNKRKGDPSSASATAKDLRKEREIDNLLKDPANLPSHLKHHERRASRIDVDMLYADTPIESSLFSLYIHQNYTQFCTELEESEGVAEWLSWIDSSGGDAWYHTNPHQFHLLSLGTLHCLPSPVPRRSQKTYKPEFFAFLQKEKDASGGVRHVKDWVAEQGITNGARVGGWSRNVVILELGGILKARDANATRGLQPPVTHRLFSHMEFTRGGSSTCAQQLDEADLRADQALGAPESSLDYLSPPSRQEDRGGWLESDDIEDFD